MSEIRDTTVLITGGASGIGRLMGELCLEKGAKRLVIWDMDAEKARKLQEIVDQLQQKYGRNVIKRGNMS